MLMPEQPCANSVRLLLCSLPQHRRLACYKKKIKIKKIKNRGKRKGAEDEGTTSRPVNYRSASNPLYHIPGRDAYSSAGGRRGMTNRCTTSVIPTTRCFTHPNMCFSTLPLTMNLISTKWPDSDRCTQQQQSAVRYRKSVVVTVHITHSLYR
jgi:hypothetical protein